jgi:FkbM family methyltransferase
MIKKLLKKLFLNRTFRVQRGNLRGVKLKLSPLQKGSVFFKNYEPDKQAAFKLFLKPGEVFFDIGANVGLHSYYVHQAVPQARITAFEPLPGNAAYIKETIAVNQFKSIALEQTAVGAHTGQVSFNLSIDNSMGKISASETGTVVQITTLDDYMKTGVPVPAVIKIDVEGAEADVLKGAAETIAAEQPVLVIELHSPQQDELVGRFLHERNYRLFRLNENINSAGAKLLLPIKNPVSPWPDPDGIHGNIVAVPAAKLTKELEPHIAS